MDRLKLHLLHIRDATEKILRYSDGITFEKFAENDRDYDAILMQIVVIGEAVNNLTAEFKEAHSDLPWYEAVGLRNRIAHGYVDTKQEIIWDTIKNDMPKLKKEVDSLLENYKG